MHEKAIIWLYWEPREGELKPAYLDLCLQSIRRHNDMDCDIVLVEPDNVKLSLPTVHPNLEMIRTPATRAEYFRCLLLYTYGGIWMDSDVIAFSSCIRWYERLEKFDFVSFEWGAGVPSLEFFAARAGSELLGQWLERMDEVLAGRILSGWTDLGSELLHPTLAKMLAAGFTGYFSYPARQTVAPITLDEFDLFFDPRRDPVEFRRGNQPLIVLYNSMFRTWLRRLRADQILKGDYLISKLFRLALSG